MDYIVKEQHKQQKTRKVINPVSVISFMFFVLISVFFVGYIWNINVHKTEEEALQLALAAESGFQKSFISKLNADERDQNLLEYKEIKNSLINLVNQNNEIEFSYIFIKRNDKVYFLADSETSDSEFYSPPGQEFYEKNDDTLRPFQNGQPLISKPISDRWGTWISVLVPMKNIEGETIAVFGVDYPAKLWHDNAFSKSILAVMFVLCVLLIAVAFNIVFIRNKELKLEKIKLQDIDAKLIESERSKTVLLDNLPGMAYRCNYDKDWTMQFVSKGCFDLTGYKPESLLYNREISFNQLIPPEYQEILWNEWKRVINLKYQLKCEYEIITAPGLRKWVLEVAQVIYDKSGNVEVLEGIVIDITESKQRLFQIEYINDHDFMTGLYNHKYYEDIKVKLDKENFIPLSIIVGDINGVRLINDAFGHNEGDKIIIETAKIMQSSCRHGDVLARTGGDEFSILLPNADRDELSKIIRRIEKSCEQYNHFVEDKSKSINLTIGYATKITKSEDIQDTEKEAIEYMYKRKLLENRSYHSSILSSIMATMYERSQETEEHAKRLALLSKMIGKKMSLPQKSIDELGLFAMLHDIGKIGIDNSILNKPDKLNNDELEIMKKHPEIGYRIAMSATELQPIAEYILTHHERWDGKGYPKGLSMENIPLLSRILAVVDTYDAMTEDRVYRKAMTKEATKEEIKKNSGTQFDPYIVEIFMNIEEGLN